MGIICPQPNIMPGSILKYLLDKFTIFPTIAPPGAFSIAANRSNRYLVTQAEFLCSPSHLSLIFISIIHYV